MTVAALAARASLTLALIAASVTAIATHHHRHVTGPRAASALAPVVPLTSRASRAHTREPLPPVKRSSAPVRQGASRSRPFLRVARPAGGNGTLADVTMYCATGNRNAAGRWPELGDVAVMDRSIPFGTRVLIEGNVYTVRDWIGWGSDFDIYGGDAGCGQQALNFGRRHLRVVVER